MHPLLVAERLRLADLLSGLSPDQWAAPSLCAGWTVRDVGAHVLGYLRFGTAKIFVGVGLTGGDTERVNAFFARLYGRRDLVAGIRAGASSRTRVPRAGLDPVLTDVLLHTYDVRLPLGLAGPGPAEEALWVAFRHLTTAPALGFRMGGRLVGLRLSADDTGWSYGPQAPGSGASGPRVSGSGVSGPGALVRGPAESLVLAMSGRAAGFAGLSGDGVPALRARVAVPGRPAAVRQRAALLARALAYPPPAARRSGSALVPPVG